MAKYNYNLKEELFTQIEAELELCDKQTTPLVYENFNNKDTKLQIIKTICDTCIQGKMEISQAIVEVEKLYSQNNID